MMLLFGKQLGKQQKMKVGEYKSACVCVLTETPNPVCDFHTLHRQVQVCLDT